MEEKNIEDLNEDEVVNLLVRNKYPAEDAQKFKEHYIDGFVLMNLHIMPGFLMPFYGLQLKFSRIMKELTGETIPLVTDHITHILVTRRGIPAATGSALVKKTKKTPKRDPLKYAFSFTFIALIVIIVCVVTGLIVSDYIHKTTKITNPALVVKSIPSRIINYEINVSDGFSIKKDDALAILRKGNNATESELELVETYRIQVKQRVEECLKRKLLVDSTKVKRITVFVSDLKLCTNISVSNVVFASKSYSIDILISYKVTTNCVSTRNAVNTIYKVRDSLFNNTVYSDLVIPGTTDIKWIMPSINIKDSAATSKTTLTDSVITTTRSFLIDFGLTPVGSSSNILVTPSVKSLNYFLYFNSKYYVIDYFGETILRFDSNLVYETMYTLTIYPYCILEVGGKFYLSDPGRGLYRYSTSFAEESSYRTNGYYGYYDTDTNLLMFTRVGYAIDAFDLDLNPVPSESYTTPNTAGYALGIAKHNGNVYVSTGNGKILVFRNKILIDTRSTLCTDSIPQISIDQYGYMLVPCSSPPYSVFLYDMDGNYMNIKRDGYTGRPYYMNYDNDGHLVLITAGDIYRF